MTTIAATPSGRKRAHSDDENEAPTPTLAKKVKIDDVTATAPKGLGAIASAIGNVFGLGVKSPVKASLVKNGLLTSGAAQASPRPAIKLAALRGTIWDKDEKPRLTTSPSKRSPTKGSPRKASPQKGRTPSKPRATPASTKRISASSARLENDSGTENSPSKSKLSTVRLGDYDTADAYETDELSANPNPTPSKRLTGKRLWTASSAPKSILSPTKGRTATPKSVKFDKRLDAEVFFDDLPKSSSAKKLAAFRKPPPQPKVANEIICGLCFKPHSKSPNQIILCDNCDYAVHQLCYGVIEIPEGDWLCKSCSQEDVVIAVPQPSLTVPVAAAPVEIPSDVPEIANLDLHLRAYQRVLLDRCTGRRRIELFGLGDVYEKARQLMEQTVVAGEGNSMLLIGARGSGKTTLLENIIDELSVDHRQDFHVVRLNGFIHTDDKLALKEIWRQLGKEMDVDDHLVNRTNYADTMASLLALLSHPSEILGADHGVTSQSIIFIIDEFDMFASHPRQTLLYNLFDVAQSRKAPIAVLGCTTRLDVVEMLEKRVKSRFSHRYVYLTLPKSLPAFWQVCRQGLIVERKDAEREGVDTGLEGYAEFQKYWSQKIDELYKQRPFQDLLQYHYYTTKSSSAFFNEWIIPLSSLTRLNLTLTPPTPLSDPTSLAPPDSRLHLLSALSDLDLALLISAARLDIVAHTDTVNFAMAYDEYASLVGRQRIAASASGMLAAGGGYKVWGKGVAGVAWERLVEMGLLVPAGIGGGNGVSGISGGGGLEGRMWKVDVALEEIPLAVKLGGVLAKWCKEI